MSCIDFLNNLIGRSYVPVELSEYSNWASSIDWEYIASAVFCIIAISIVVRGIFTFFKELF